MAKRLVLHGEGNEGLRKSLIMTFLIHKRSYFRHQLYIYCYKFPCVLAQIPYRPIDEDFYAALLNFFFTYIHWPSFYRSVKIYTHIISSLCDFLGISYSIYSSTYVELCVKTIDKFTGNCDNISIT